MKGKKMFLLVIQNKIWNRENNRYIKNIGTKLNENKVFDYHFRNIFIQNTCNP